MASYSITSSARPSTVVMIMARAFSSFARLLKKMLDFENPNVID